MKYKVYLDDTLIGESDLEDHNPKDGSCGGKFFPTPSYEKICSVFQMKSKVLFRSKSENQAIYEEYNRQRALMNITIVDSTNQVWTNREIHITDFSDGAPNAEKCLIEVWGNKE
jgi:hypothetical protein